ncbi:MAG: gamma-glutamylcyclotransferase family protein [Beijerinckiaceae bacterium]
MTYFAYGNLLDIDFMRSICPSAEAVGVMRLYGYEMGFAKCANPAKGGCTLVPTPGATMWGVNYVISDDDMRKLDEASGAHNQDWVRRPITVRDVNDRPVETTTYMIPQPSGPHAPSDSYVGPIFKGAAALGFPAHYVERLRAIIAAAQERAAL